MQIEFNVTLLFRNTRTHEMFIRRADEESRHSFDAVIQESFSQVDLFSDSSELYCLRFL